MDNEEELIEMSKRGDPAAFSGLYNMHAEAVYDSIIRLIKHTAEADDILQESFIAAFRGIASFKPGGGFRAWVKRIAINKSIDCIRKRKMAIVELQPDLIANTEEEAIDEEEFEFTMNSVMTAIDLLPDNYRTIFLLYAVENISQPEIARMLAMNYSTVRIQYQRAKQRILCSLAKSVLS
jgi:RNA polymerase sigma-70 factor (ECF subfamily)